MEGIEQLTKFCLGQKRMPATLAHMTSHMETLYFLPPGESLHHVIQRMADCAAPHEKKMLTRLRMARNFAFLVRVIIHQENRLVTIRKGTYAFSRMMKKVVSSEKDHPGKEIWLEVRSDSPMARKTATELRQQLANLRKDLRVSLEGEPPVHTLILAGAKNAGKSQFVNCILGEDAASTDIHTEKMRAAHYEGGGFSIIDTAGANEARAGKSPAWGWQNIDAFGPGALGIFVMNYSSYLTTDEEACLRAFCKTLEAHGMEPPLILVNRMDELYATPEEKSFARASDYLRSRLEALGYRSLLVLPISATAYRYAARAEQKMNASGIRNHSIRDVRKLLEKEDDPTIAAFLEEMLFRIKRFHGIQEPTIEDVKRISGVPRALAYLNGRRKG